MAQGTVLASSTGKNAESKPLTLDIGTSKAKAAKRVAMSLGKGDEDYCSMPDLAPGDVIEVSAELQVTTDSRIPGPDAVSKPYSYDPKLSARLLLAEGPNVTDPGARRAVLLTDKPPVVCTPPQHHCVLAFAAVAYTVPAGGLPRTGASCANLLLAAEMKTSNPRPYTARVSTQVILSDKATGTDLHGPARDIGAFNGEIGQYNGSNCLPNRSLETHKYGTLRILRRAPEAFVN